MNRRPVVFFRKFFVFHQRTILALLFLFCFSLSISYATPPTTPYLSTDQQLDPACAPGDINCTVSIFPDQTSHAGEFLMTDGAGTLSWDTAATPTLQQVTTAGATATQDIYLQSVRVGRGAGAITSNVALGEGALNANTSAVNATAIGDNALLLQTTSPDNTAIGSQAMASLVTNSGYNTAVGSYALNGLLTGSGSNTAIGSYSMWKTTTATANTAVGVSSLINNTTGTTNVAVGSHSLRTNTTGSWNIAVGHRSLYNATTAEDNVAVGSESGTGITTGWGNTIVGKNARYVSNGAFNTILGRSAGYSSTGDSNVFLGYSAGYSSTGDNKLYIANTSTTTPLIYGDFSTPSFVINGGPAADVASAIFNITSTTKGALMPRMTTSQRNTISSPAEGLLVFDTDINTHYEYTGSAWQALYNGAPADADYGDITVSSSGSVWSIDSSTVALGDLLTQGTATDEYCLTSETGGGALMEWQACGTTETASNGLTKTGNDIALGGSLTGDTTIANGANTLLFTANTLAGDAAVSITSNSTAAASNLQKGLNVSLSGANATNSQTTYGGYFSNTHTGGGVPTNYGIYATSSGGLFNYGIAGVSPDYIGVFGSTSTGFGIAGDASTSGIGVTGSSSTGIAVRATTSGTGGLPFSGSGVASTTNTVLNLLRLTRTTSGTAADGIGASLRFDLQSDDGSTNIANTISSRLTTAAAATRTSEFSITGVNSGTTATLFVISGSGSTGIGDTTPDYRLDVADTTIDNNIFSLTDSDGECLYDPEAGSVTVSCSSDEQLKANITDATPVLAYFTDFRIRDYDVIASGDHMTGVIAQEILTTHPELVTRGSNGYYSVQLPNQWKIVKAIQEMNLNITTIADLDTDNTWRDSIVGWLGSIENGIGTIFSKKIQTQELCIGDEDDQVCVTKDQLRDLLQQGGSASTSAPAQPQEDSVVQDTPEVLDVPVTPEIVDVPEDTAVTESSEPEPTEEVPVE